MSIAIAIALFVPTQPAYACGPDFRDSELDPGASAFEAIFGMRFIGRPPRIVGGLGWHHALDRRDPKVDVGGGLAAEIGLDERITLGSGATAFLVVNSVRTSVTALYRTDLERMTIRPEIGVAFGFFSITYGYTLGRDIPQRHDVGVSVALPLQ
jgi:hypothetical protein